MSSLLSAAGAGSSRAQGTPGPMHDSYLSSPAGRAVDVRVLPAACQAGFFASIRADAQAAQQQLIS